MATTTAPDKGMAMLVPVGGCSLDRAGDLGPTLETTPFERERAEHFPPRLDQVQVGRTLGLEDELPAGMGQREQQHVGRPMDVEVVDNGVDPFDLVGNPYLDVVQ